MKPMQKKEKNRTVREARTTDLWAQESDALPLSQNRKKYPRRDDNSEFRKNRMLKIIGLDYPGLDFSAIKDPEPELKNLGQCCSTPLL